MASVITKFFDTNRMLKNVEKQGELPPTKQLIKNTVKMAWPSMAESFLVSLVSFIDTVMVATLGTAAVSAVGLTTQPKFIGLSIFFAFSAAASALVARRRGEGDQKSANQILRHLIVLTVLSTIVICLLCIVFAEPIIKFTGAKQDTIGMATGYFKIIMGGLIFQTITMIINAAQRGVGNTKIAMRTNVVSNLVNIVFNYLLINGKFGFPQLGTNGAAIATVIGTVVAFGMALASVMHPDGYLYLFGHGGFFEKDPRNTKGLLNVGVGSFGEQIFLRVGFLIFAIVVANLGTKAFASHMVGMNVMGIAFSFGDGLSVASVALVGQSLGAKRKDLAIIYGAMCQRFGFLCSCALSVFLIFGSRNIAALFDKDPDVIRTSQTILYLLAIIVFAQISQVITSGCLRGAGDSKFVAMVSLVSVAILRPGAAFLLCYPLGFGLFGAWGGILLDQILRLTLSRMRFNSGKWLHIII